MTEDNVMRETIEQWKETHKEPARELDYEMLCSILKKVNDESAVKVARNPLDENREWVHETTSYNVGRVEVDDEGRLVLYMRHDNTETSADKMQDQIKRVQKQIASIITILNYCICRCLTGNAANIQRTIPKIDSSIGSNVERCLIVCRIIGCFPAVGRPAAVDQVSFLNVDDGFVGKNDGDFAAIALVGNKQLASSRLDERAVAGNSNIFTLISNQRVVVVMVAGIGFGEL